MIIRNFKDHEFAQAHVVLHDDGTIDLVSYTTLVCRIFPDGRLECTGLYSRTTIKHIGWFMREYTQGTYYDVKKAYQGQMYFNVFTGEYTPMYPEENAAQADQA